MTVGRFGTCVHTPRWVVAHYDGGHVRHLCAHPWPLGGCATRTQTLAGRWAIAAPAHGPPHPQHVPYALRGGAQGSPQSILQPCAVWQHARLTAEHSATMRSVRVAYSSEPSPSTS
eukprot:366390-Chlamydomonas_euryale.AAC.18